MSNHGNSKLPGAAPSLNVYKKVAVIRHPDDRLTYEDMEGNVQSVSVEELAPIIATAVSAWHGMALR
jgi:hypothetical protein